MRAARVGDLTCLSPASVHSSSDGAARRRKSGPRRSLLRFHACPIFGGSQALTRFEAASTLITLLGARGTTRARSCPVLAPALQFDLTVAVYHLIVEGRKLLGWNDYYLAIPPRHRGNTEGLMNREFAPDPSVQMSWCATKGTTGRLAARPG